MTINPKSVQGDKVWKFESLFNFEGSIRIFRWEEKKNRQTLAREEEHGGVAQLGEHLPCKQGVRSSILLISTMGKGKAKTKD